MARKKGVNMEDLWIYIVIFLAIIFFAIVLILALANAP